MATFRIKLCGLNDIDIRTLKSMLSVSNDQLSNKWEIVESDPAELYIYSFDTEEGMVAWQKHDPRHLSALLSLDNDSDEAFDIFIKKPLRTKNFTTVLNDIEKRTIVSKTKQNKSPSSFSSLLSSLGNVLGKKSTRLARPVLDLSIPEQGSESADVILDLPILEQFLKDIDHNNDILKAEDITANLLSLNYTNIQTEKRFKLLELYSSSIRQLLSNQLSEKNKVNQGSHTDYIKVIHTLSRLLKEMAVGYQLIINDYYQQNKKPKPQNTLLIAINRTAEYLELSILHAYHYYFSPPKKALNTLHQLYLFCEYHHVLKAQVPSINSESISFIHTYTAILLTGIAAPRRLLKADIFKLFELIHQFADKITISQMQEQQLLLDAGYFKIDMTSDNLPSSLTESELEQSAQSQIRLFNTQPILESIEILFQQESHSNDQKLLKKIIPQFNATYARHFKRKRCLDKPQVELLLGITAISDYLTTKTYSDSYHCVILDKGTGGIMISCDTLDAYFIEIGDIVGILDSNSKHQLAIVRWMTATEEGKQHFGLEFQLGHEPIPVKMSLENKTDSFNGLLLPDLTKKNMNNTIIVNKGTYLPLQTINVTERKKTYKIVIDSLVDSSLNCEQFSFNKK